MPIDSAQLVALVAVIEEGSFERAASVLHVTRSAVSQRIKLLEERVGQVLVRRSTPCMPTEAGQAIFRHAQQMALSEADALGAIAGTGAHSAVRLSLGVNADSLATWFPQAMAAAAADDRGITFDIHTEDQDHSSSLLREGRVMAAVTSEPVAVQGCQVLAVGTMRYRAVCSPDYWQRQFALGVNAVTLAAAPTLVFNRKDTLQARFARQITRKAIDPPVHWLPSSQAFVDAALWGLGWGMNPEPLIAGWVASGRLVDMAPDKPVDVALYWQYWRLNVRALNRMTDAVQQAATQALRA